MMTSIVHTTVGGGGNDTVHIIIGGAMYFNPCYCGEQGLVNCAVRLNIVHVRVE